MYIQSNNQQKQQHLGMTEWGFRFMIKQEFYKNGLENLSDFKIQFIVALLVLRTSNLRQLEAACRRCPSIQVLLKISQISQESTCVGASNAGVFL